MTEADWLFGLLALGAIVAVWHDSLRAREHALVVIKRACRELNVQLLDETVVVSKLSLQRSPRGWPRLRRTFQFDVSINGADRFRGHAQVVGNRVESLHVPSSSGNTIIDYLAQDRSDSNREG